MKLSNEVIALLVGLITTVLVPFLNKKFGNNPMIGQAANVVVDELEKQVKPVAMPTVTSNVTPAPMPTVTAPDGVKPAPMPTIDTTPVIPPNENGAM